MKSTSSVYDECGHMCGIDEGLIEKDIYLYFSGYLKPLFEDNPDIEGISFVLGYVIV